MAATQPSIEGYMSHVPVAGPNLGSLPEQLPKTLIKPSSATRNAVETLKAKQLISSDSIPPLEDLVLILVTQLDNTKKLAELNEVKLVGRAIAQVMRHFATQLTKAETIEDSVNAMMGKLTQEVKDIAEGITRNANVLDATAKNYLSITKEAAEIHKNIAEASATITQAPPSTAPGRLLYSQVAATNAPPPAQNATAQKVQNRLGIQHRQFFITFNEGAQDTPKDTSEETCRLVKEKFSEALAKVADGNGTPTEVRTATILNKGGILFELRDARTAKWLREGDNREKVAEHFHPECFFRDRTYPILLRFVPITADIYDPDTIRKIESNLDLPAGSITGASWIKDPARRSRTQKVANVKLACSSPEVANKILTSTVRIEHRVVETQKETKDPVRCNKCQEYGHFAAKCASNTSTCGICGDSHRTNECNSSNHWCVSCREASHSSISRDCPAFQSRLSMLNERSPEYTLPYYQTDEPWTWELPSKPLPPLLPRPPRFPTHPSMPPHNAPFQPTLTHNFNFWPIAPNPYSFPPFPTANPPFNEFFPPPQALSQPPTHPSQQWNAEIPPSSQSPNHE